MSLAMRLPEEVIPLFEALDLSPDAVFVTDRQNQIVAWNLSAERLLGYSSEEAMGTSCARLMEGCDTWGNRYCAENCPIREMAARNEVVKHFDLKFNAKDGRAVVSDVSILHFSVPPPHHFFLAHILKPSEHSPALVTNLDVEAAPGPRLSLITARESPDARARKLTAREVEILGMLAAGKNTAEIASLLNISALTARNHIQNILEKLEVHSKAEAVSFAFQKRLF